MTETLNKRLLSYVERLENLIKEKEEIGDDIKQVKAEAKGVGFDVKTINKIIALRRLSQDQRDEEEALLDLYKAALGMLDGTPLGEAAIKRIQRKPDGGSGAGGQMDIEDDFEQEEAPEEEAAFMPDVDIAKARELGAEAARTGVPVIKNPFPARDPRRAAWDEAWCEECGTDGMDIPEAFKRTKPKKDDENKKED